MYHSTLYRYSPKWLQELLIASRVYIRESLRTGKIFKQTLAEIEKSQWFDRPQLEAFQLQKLKQQLEIAATLPYYQNYLTVNHLQVDDFQTLADFKKLPLIDKTALRAWNEFAVNGKVTFKAHTSGTTGSPLTILQDIEAISKECAFLWRQRTWAGYQRGQKSVWIRGDMIIPVTQQQPPFWRFNRAENMLMFSAFHLTEQNAVYYLEQLVKFDPVLIQAYPSSIIYLARILESRGSYYQGKSLKSILTSSETITSKDKEMLVKRFTCQVFDWYGSVERVAAIGTCEQGNLHLLSDYGYVESDFLSEQPQQIIASNFNNPAMPIFRYKTGDLFELEAHDKICECKRFFPLVKQISGRMDDVIKLANGRSVGRLDRIFLGIEYIVEAQIVQKSLDKIEINVVPMTNFSEKQIQQLLKNAISALGKEPVISIVLVDRIFRSPNGKLKNVISKL